MATCVCSGDPGGSARWASPAQKRPLKRLLGDNGPPSRRSRSETSAADLIVVGVVAELRPTASSHFQLVRCAIILGLNCILAKRSLVTLGHLGEGSVHGQFSSQRLVLLRMLTGALMPISIRLRVATCALAAAMALSPPARALVIGAYHVLPLQGYF